MAASMQAPRSSSTCCGKRLGLRVGTQTQESVRSCLPPLQVRAASPARPCQRPWSATTGVLDGNPG
eukprot:6080794-Lingulodinium_polyedra.AAC.1